MTKKTLNFIDLFAGAGGLSCGLEMAGLNCLLGVDYDKDAMNTFALNHKNANTYCGDIGKLTYQTVKSLTANKKIHVIAGGPPCQGFSTAGVGDPKDLRNKLFMEFVRIVKEVRPEFIIMENVTGLVAKKNEKVLKAIFKQFHKLGYSIDAKILASHHYGVPEKRKRTIIIGSLKNQKIPFPMPTHDCVIGNSYIPAKTVGDSFKQLKRKKNLKNHDIELSKVKNKLDLERLKRIPEGKGIRYEKDEKDYLTKRLSLNIDWKNIPENRFRQTKYQRLDRARPSPTIMTHRHTYFHPVEDRYLTPREAASLQSFPLNFEFSGTITKQWRQIGNAVPPLLGKVIGETIISMNTNKDKLRIINKDRAKKIPSTITKMRKSAFIYNASENN